MLEFGLVDCAWVLFGWEFDGSLVYNLRMKINPLLKFMSNVKSEDVLHSSGYARAQNERSFGASGGMSFEKRQEIEQNRKMVGGYDKSMLFNLRRPKVGGGVGGESGGGAASGRFGGNGGNMAGARFGGGAGDNSNNTPSSAAGGRFGGPKQFSGGTGISDRFKR